MKSQERARRVRAACVTAVSFVASIFVGACSNGAGAPRSGAATDPTEAPLDGGAVSSGGNASNVGCAGAAYAEALPSEASLASLPFSKDADQQYLFDALEARYPVGRFILERGIASSSATTQGNCFRHFIRDESSGPAVLQQAEVLVHECGHAFDQGDSVRERHAYHLRPDLTFTCAYGGASALSGKTFARSLLRGDAFYPKRPACDGRSAPDCDIYADTYLDGSPDDAMLQSGDAGYDMTLEEATQYVNSLATGLAFRDAAQGSHTSERDGVLTFLWYIERYFKLAHERYPDVYAVLTSDACWRQATLSVWDRASYFLHATEGVNELGVYDEKISPLVNDASLLAEIDALRALECK
jgi:hypothetical protein